MCVRYRVGEGVLVADVQVRDVYVRVESDALDHVRHSGQRPDLVRRLILQPEPEVIRAI